jgi:hypothetical protein
MLASKRTPLGVALVLVPVLSGLLLADTRSDPPAPRVPWDDVTPPVASLHVFGDPNGAGYFAVVDASDASGIASVEVGVAGSIVLRRIRPPYRFFVNPFTGVLGLLPRVGDPEVPPEFDPNAPVEICALVADRAGNSTTPCEMVTPPRPPLVCSDNGGCPPSSFCSKPVGACGEEGVCAAPPLVCRIFFPPPLQGGVCGCDGMDYRDECAAQQVGVNLAHDGPCVP